MKVFVTTGTKSRKESFYYEKPLRVNDVKRLLREKGYDIITTIIYADATVIPDMLPKGDFPHHHLVYHLTEFIRKNTVPKGDKNDKESFVTLPVEKRLEYEFPDFVPVSEPDMQKDIPDLPRHKIERERKKILKKFVLSAPLGPTIDNANGIRMLKALTQTDVGQYLQTLSEFRNDALSSAASYRLRNAGIEVIDELVFQLFIFYQERRTEFEYRYEVLSLALPDLSEYSCNKADPIKAWNQLVKNSSGFIMWLEGGEGHNIDVNMMYNIGEALEYLRFGTHCIKKWLIKAFERWAKLFRNAAFSDCEKQDICQFTCMTKGGKCVSKPFWIVMEDVVMSFCHPNLSPDDWTSEERSTMVKAYSRFYDNYSKWFGDPNLKPVSGQEDMCGHLITMFQHIRKASEMQMGQKYENVPWSDIGPLINLSDKDWGDLWGKDTTNRSRSMKKLQLSADQGKMNTMIKDLSIIGTLVGRH
jgi:hypothetical protein